MSSPEDSLKHIGSALPRLIFALAQAVESKPAFVAKGDTEDWHWKIFTDEEGKWNFVYILPTTAEYQELSIVVPKAFRWGG